MNGSDTNEILINECNDFDKNAATIFSLRHFFYSILKNEALLQMLGSN